MSETLVAAVVAYLVGLLLGYLTGRAHASLKQAEKALRKLEAPDA
jgi:hypothetical protein